MYCSTKGTVRVGCRYGFFWYFYQDGTIQHEVKLTGILSTNGLSEGEVRFPPEIMKVLCALPTQASPSALCSCQNCLWVTRSCRTTISLAIPLN